MDTGNRKFGLAAIVAGGAVAAGEFTIAVLVFAVYTVANVVLKLLDAEPEVE